MKVPRGEKDEAKSEKGKDESDKEVHVPVASRGRAYGHHNLRRGAFLDEGDGILDSLEGFQS